VPEPAHLYAGVSRSSLDALLPLAGSVAGSVEVTWVIGDRLDFQMSSHGKMKGEKGYVRKI
jgi:hypothetical protein